MTHLAALEGKISSRGVMAKAFLKLILHRELAGILSKRGILDLVFLHVLKGPLACESISNWLAIHLRPRTSGCYSIMLILDLVVSTNSNIPNFKTL
jgi:hypothetical protein